PQTWRPDATYLITGGIGGLGLQIARWMAEQGARHLGLLGRRGPPDRAGWAAPSNDSDDRRPVAPIAAMERLRADVRVVAADVADVARMTALFEEFGRTTPPLRGVVHAAGTFAQGPLTSINIDMVRSVMRAKVGGGWLLDRLTRGMSLDFFLLLSSGA